MFSKTNLEDYDYVDVEGVIPGEEGGPPIKMRRGRGRPKKNTSGTLEEGPRVILFLFIRNLLS